MAKLIIRDTPHPQLNGEYELDFSHGFTKKEHFLMKREASVVTADYAPGAPADMNLLTAWGLVALSRAGKGHLAPLFMDTNDEQTDWEFDDSEVKEVDAELPPKNAESPESEPSTSIEISGAGTNGDSADSQATSPSLTGAQT